jgi:hypothetical protein
MIIGRKWEETIIERKWEEIIIERGRENKEMGDYTDYVQLERVFANLRELVVDGDLVGPLDGLRYRQYSPEQLGLKGSIQTCSPP